MSWEDVVVCFVISKSPPRDWAISSHTLLDVVEYRHRLVPCRLTLGCCGDLFAAD